MTATQIISLRILTLVNNGMDLVAAFDEVLGAGSYSRFAGNLYDALQSK